MSRHRGCIVKLFVYYTSEIFIHPLSKGSFGLSYVLEATFRTVNDVNQITEF